MQNKMKKRLIFGLAALAVLGIEVLIALFVHDRFVRPYLGDVLAVVFVYLGLRVLFPEKPQFVSLIAFGIAVAVELVQLTSLSEIFGEGSVFSVIVGGTFDFADLACYFVGGTVCFLVDIYLYKKK
ncbi:MAG: DUF2809 domain-containing protein [Oscillospiraceae bacterium]